MIPRPDMLENAFRLVGFHRLSTSRPRVLENEHQKITLSSMLEKVKAWWNLRRQSRGFDISGLLKPNVSGAYVFQA
jgi:hypothetical protein